MYNTCNECVLVLNIYTLIYSYTCKQRYSWYSLCLCFCLCSFLYPTVSFSLSLSLFVFLFTRSGWCLFCLACSDNTSLTLSTFIERKLSLRSRQQLSRSVPLHVEKDGDYQRKVAGVYFIPALSQLFNVQKFSILCECFSELCCKVVLDTVTLGVTE